MTHNPQVIDEPGDGRQRHEVAGPGPIPELDVAGTAPVPSARPQPKGPQPTDHQPPVTDDDRQLYGRLLDSAMERGLLGAYDYETRLSDLAEAPTIDEMKKIVTELPIFSTSAPIAKPRKSSIFSTSPGSPGSSSTPGSVYPRIPGVATKGRSNPWTKLIIVLVLVVVIFVAASIYAEHLVHNQHNSSSAAATWTTSAALPVPVPASGITILRL